MREKVTTQVILVEVLLKIIKLPENSDYEINGIAE